MVLGQAPIVTTVPCKTIAGSGSALNDVGQARAKDDILIMAPGPINRGVEVTPDVADGPHSVILDQVTNGLAVRMAVLWLVVGAGSTR